MNIAPTELNPQERHYVQAQLGGARTAAAAAWNLLLVRTPEVMPDVHNQALAHCRDAVEQLYDALQVDLPLEMVADVRHALQEMQDAVKTLDTPRGPGIVPGHPTEPLARTIKMLEDLEHRVAAGH